MLCSLLRIIVLRAQTADCPQVLVSLFFISVFGLKADISRPTGLSELSTACSSLHTSSRESSTAGITQEPHLALIVDDVRLPAPLLARLHHHLQQRLSSYNHPA